MPSLPGGASAHFGFGGCLQGCWPGTGDQMPLLDPVMVLEVARAGEAADRPGTAQRVPDPAAHQPQQRPVLMGADGCRQGTSPPGHAPEIM